MSHALLRTLALLAAVALPPLAAVAQGAEGAVDVYKYAMENPVENSALGAAPSLGASVPAAVTLSQCEGEKTYAYFYYNGLPVIVDQSTRSVVRIGATEAPKRKGGLFTR